jgi:hypothetical protein
MEFNFKNELKNIILVAFRYFEFLHSQGQSRRFDARPITSALPQTIGIFRAGRPSLKGANNGSSLMLRDAPDTQSEGAEKRPANKFGWSTTVGFRDHSGPGSDINALTNSANAGHSGMPATR